MASRIPYHNPVARSIPINSPAQERNKFYGSSRWRDLRDAFLARVENRLCARCTRGGDTALATTVHHVKERLEHPELAYSWSNLEPLCRSCHSKTHKSPGKR